MRETVLTGIGVVAPNGVGTETYWAATLEGRSAIAAITRFDPAPYPVRLAGEVTGFEPREHVPSRLMPQTDHSTRLSLAAAAFALDDAGLGAGIEASSPDTTGGSATDGAGPVPAAFRDGFGIGISTASSMGGFEFGQRELQNLWGLGAEHVSAYQSFAWFYAVNSGQISIRHGLRGPGSALVADQSGGLDAVGNARRAIRKGAGAMVTGGVDSSLCPLGLAGRLATGELSAAEDATRAYLPFHPAAGGHVPGEGGAILVVEEADSARARGVRVYARVAGYASTFDPRPDGGTGLERALRAALADARTDPSQVDVVFADAAGSPAADRAEAAAVRAVFGPRAVPVAAPKTMTGRLGAGGASLDLAAAALSLRDGVIPPAVNVGSPAEEYGIDLVTDSPREADLRTCVVLARGRGGFNAAVVLWRPA